jgi:hypothetical protein
VTGRPLKNAHLPFDRLTALSRVEGRRYPRSSSLRRTSMYASLFGISGALHLDVFEQPEQRMFFSNLVVKGNLGEITSHE